MNQAFLIGSLKDDLKLQKSSKGKTFIRGKISIWKPSDGERATDEISFLAFDKIAEKISKLFRRKMKIALSGKLETFIYTHDGKPDPRLEFVVSYFEYGVKDSPRIQEEAARQ